MSDYQPHPLRIQRKRTKGFRLPPGAVCVTRPGRWGNPYATADEFERAFNDIRERWCEIVLATESQARMIEIVRTVGELRGKLIACWCPLTRPCHGDIIARAANK